MPTIQIDGTLADAREVARVIAGFLALEFGELAGGDLTAEGGELEISTDDGLVSILVMPSRIRVLQVQRMVEEYSGPRF